MMCSALKRFRPHGLYVLFNGTIVAQERVLSRTDRRIVQYRAELSCWVFVTDLRVHCYWRVVAGTKVGIGSHGQ